MPQEYLTMLLQQMQQSHNELCEKLVTATQATTHQRDRHFAGCKLSFSGAKESVEDALEVFIDGIQTYKDCANISDENALRGLSFLFTGLAATWWNGVRKNVKTWNEAIADLQHAFGKRKAPFLIFREIFREEQSDEKTEIFICKTRALIAQLPYSLEETIQIDIVYGLLNRRIRKRVPRESVTSFNDLLRKTRSVEDSLVEMNETNGTTSANVPNVNVNAVNGRSVTRHVGNNVNDRNPENKSTNTTCNHSDVPGFVDDRGRHCR
ncbi:activity-regulated cytoskeleton associated protein 2-like [Cydia pomonella]|uniref:activity-regulated cytoskeleton associated protein 2-like n=1 Tax=Cydia pomonella TaxID=82600 RepID=UPI002ADDDCB4|nr:activity-regulated cytoskeleton associated protein 2-like [Cydia pomonella]